MAGGNEDLNFQYNAMVLESTIFEATKEDGGRLLTSNSHTLILDERVVHLIAPLTNMQAICSIGAEQEPASYLIDVSRIFRSIGILHLSGLCKWRTTQG